MTTHATASIRERLRLAAADPAGEAEAVHPVNPAMLAAEAWDAELAKPLAVTLERVGPSYRVNLRDLDATVLFRDVRTAGELSADVAVGQGGRHLFRTTITLTLAGRDKIAKVAADLGTGTVDAWRRGTFAAVEQVLYAEDRLGDPVDLRTASLAMPAGGTHVAAPLWPTGTVVLVSPGDSGKSTTARAIAVSLASGIEVIPGIVPSGPTRPVLFVAAEDPVAYWHSRSIEAICRGIGIERRNLAQPIELFDARGRPLHRIARAIAERAADYGAVMLDSQQALLAQVDATAGIRDRDSLFWNAVDQLEGPSFIIAHPNRADARGWDKADGRIAGSEVNRDRARMAWRGTWKDEPAVVGTSFRRYTLENVKNNHGPKEPPLSFGAAWTFGLDGDPGLLTFTPSDAIASEPGGRPSRAVAETLPYYLAGATTSAALRELMPELSDDAARQRLSRVRRFLGEDNPDRDNRDEV